MAGKLSKRQLQANAAAQGASAPASSKKESASSPPPPPFSSAPARLAPFVSQLDREKVYIVHLDTHPWQFKRKIFIVPVVLNLTIAVLLLWRWWFAASTYLSLLLVALRMAPHPTGTKRALFGLLLWRVAVFCFDFLLIKIVAPWPFTFFFEAPGNPMSWRWVVGFQDVEIVVRMSRKWSGKDLIGGAKKGHDSAFFKTRVLPAIERSYVREKSGYMMMGKDYELDFHMMTVATQMVKKSELKNEDFAKTVLVFSEPRDEWLAWSVHEVEDGVEQDERKKIVAFKVCPCLYPALDLTDAQIQDRLTLMGKEHLFFRWIELLQYESSQPGGFTKDRQAAIVVKARTMFEEQGIELDDFLGSEGVSGLPGLDVPR